MITCDECRASYEADAPSRHNAPCGAVCLMAAGMGTDGKMAPQSPPLPSEMHCPPLRVGGARVYEMPGRCPKGCYATGRGNQLPPPAPADYVLLQHGPCGGAGQRPATTRWRANPGGYHYGRRAEGCCPTCGAWIVLHKPTEQL